jgi:hypothetical protein
MHTAVQSVQRFKGKHSGDFVVVVGVRVGETTSQKFACHWLIVGGMRCCGLEETIIKPMSKPHGAYAPQNGPLKDHQPSCQPVRCNSYAWHVHACMTNTLV